MKSKRFFLVAALMLGLVSGCALMGKTDSSNSSVSDDLDRVFEHEPSADASSEVEVLKVANPPAKTVRFDGREIVLGTVDTAPLETEAFCEQLRSLLEQERHFSATNLINAHTDVAEQAIWERFADASENQLVRFISAVLSQNVPRSISCDSMLLQLSSNPVDGQAYQRSRSAFTSQLKTEDPSQQDADKLKEIAQRLDHPLVMLDALRLLALRELVASRHGWAESLFLQATKIAEEHHDDARAAELWLMVATTANRSERQSDAKSAWQKATAKYADLHLTSSRPLNVGFWMRADEQRPIEAKWPDQISQALIRFCRSGGCKPSEQSPAPLVLWCAVATALYDDSTPQLALVNFKKAETFATGDDVMWLRIAQSKCLAALGQSHAAAALLSGPAASHDPAIAIASTAALGSAKLQAGTYQQGIQLLTKALNDDRAVDWPDFSRAQADLALARLILGETEQGLEALHTAQETFESLGDRESLLQALDNETRILDHEGRTQESAAVRARIRAIEQA